MPTTDKNGREIMPGDTVKVYHFTGARRKKYFMYQYVKEITHGERHDYLHIRHLNLVDTGYRMLMDGKHHDEIEIVQGYGSNGLCFDQRPRT